MPTPMAIGLAIDHVRACHFAAKVTVSVVSTTVRLAVERPINLTKEGRTMMETSLAWPDNFRRGLATHD